MKMGFEESQTPFESGSQKARFWTERWVADWGYCPNCGHAKLTQYANNKPLADFHCDNCNDEFELKAHKKPAFGKKVADGAYDTKIARLQSNSNPNLLLMNYDGTALQVQNLLVVPKHFFTPAIVERRRALKPTARRAGWVGSNILISKVPEAGKLFLIKNGTPVAKNEVRDRWERTRFLQNQSLEGRGWLVEVLNCVEALNSPEFRLDEVYAFEKHLSKIYPENNNVRPKIRQQLQVLRDNGYLSFAGRGKYQLI